MLKFAFGDREYAYDATLTVEEAMLLQDKAGLGVNEVDAALAKGNPYAIAAFMLVLMRRAGVVLRWQDVLTMDIRTFQIIPDDANVDTEAEAAPGGPAQDPTGTGPTPDAATAATS
jgi:hypothetical protein